MATIAKKVKHPQSLEEPVIDRIKTFLKIPKKEIYAII
jgi:hypothetical protein